MFKSLLPFTDTYGFTLILLQKCFTFQEIHGKDSDKYFGIQVPNELQIGH